MYGVAVLSLIGVLIDGIVMWYEGLALVLTYIFYIVGKSERRWKMNPIFYYTEFYLFRASAMVCNDIISIKVRTFVARVNASRQRKVRPFREVTEIQPLLGKNGSDKSYAAAPSNVANGMYPSLDTIGENNSNEGERNYFLDNSEIFKNIENQQISFFRMYFKIKLSLN